MTTQTREFTLPGFTFRPLATPSGGSTEMSVWFVRAEPGAVGQAHQMTSEEIFTVTAGRMTLRHGGTEQELIAPASFAVRPNTDFALHNPNSEPAELVVCAKVGVQAMMNGETITPPWTV